MRAHSPSRRQFLKAASAAAVMPCVAAGVTDGWTMKLSTSTVQFRGLSIEKACRRISGLGFTGIDIWSAFHGCPHLDSAAERLGPDGLRSLLAEHGLDLFSFSVYRGGYRKYADLLGGAGGGVAVRGSTGGEAEPGELTGRMRSFIDGLQPLIDLAEKHDSYLAIENHGGALLSSMASLRAFVEINDSPRLGIALAPYHLQARGAPVPEAIRICGDQLLFFYAWQHESGPEQLHGYATMAGSPGRNRV
ncbi:MAG: sugar phosphate isomerase/epimerase [Planctomycetota bacterium]